MKPIAVIGFLRIATLIFAFSFGSPAYGEVRLVPDENIEIIAEKPEPLPLDMFIRGALIASGTEAERLPYYTDLLKDLLSDAPLSTGNAGTDGERLLQWLHDKQLTRYVESQTRIDVLLDDGRYNCVSSAILYMILARSRRIAVHGVLTPDHAFCRLPDAADGVDVETTIPFGFDPGRRREAVDSFTGRTGYTYVPPGDYEKRQDIGDKEMLSLIYQNRISVLQRRGEWDEAVGLSRDRWVLADSDTARMDFVTSLNNLAAEADRSGRNEEVLGILREASELLDIEDELRQSAEALFGNAVTRYLRSNRINEASNLSENETATALLDEGFLAEKRRDIANRVLENLISNGEFDVSVDAVNSALTDGTITRDRWEELALHLWSTEARRRSSGSNWLEGWIFLEDAPKSLETIPRWGELMATYAHNAAVGYHNAFVNAFRRMEWDKARDLLDEGLSRFPDNQTLRQDRDTLNSRITEN